MSMEVLIFIGKFLWAGFTLLLGGIIKTMWSEHRDYKIKTEDRLKVVEQKVVHLEANMVTKDKLDETLDRKMEPLKEQINVLNARIENLRSELRHDISELGSDIKELLREQRK
jgi:capsule polysaccharide export protein KpsE/RkpR